jgi:hypothetical protein
MIFTKSIFIILLVMFQLFGKQLKLFAQNNPNFKQLLIENGMQSNNIYNLHVSKSGLLYIAHSKGLSSFDGTSFYNYYHKERPFTEVTNIMETASGEIFCKAFNNVLFRKVGDSLRWFVSISPYSYGFAPSGSYNNEVYSVTNDSIIVFNSLTNQMSAIALKNSKPLPQKQNIVFIVRSNLNGVATLFALNDKRELYYFTETFGSYHSSKNDLFFVKNKFKGEVFYYTNNEYLKLNNFNETSAINYVSTTDSIIWVCTTNGLYYRNKNKKEELFKYIMPGYDISDVKQTNEGNYFISTLGQGLFFVPNFNVQKISNIPSNITAISGFDNKLLIGTKESGLIEHDLSTSQNKTILSANTESSVSYIYKNKEKNTILVSSNRTLINNTVYNFITKDYCIVDDNLLIATDIGMYLYSFSKNNHWLNNYVIAHPNNNSKLKKLSFSNEHTSSVKYNTKNNTVYISNYTGLLEMANGFTNYKLMPEPNCVLKDICIWNGDLLLASKDKGILKWTGSSYETAFPKQQTSGILYKFEIVNNELWILGEEAIYCYKDNQLYTYNNQDGVNAENFKNFFIGKDIVFAASSNSIIQFSKNANSNNVSNPVFILNKVVNLKQNKKIGDFTTLNHNQNNIQFFFSLIAYANAQNTHIAYSVNNQDLVHLPNNRRDLILDLLKPDKYTVEFYIVSNDITSIKPILVFNFTIKPPFYNSWWFYLLCAIALGLLIYLIIKQRVKKERAQLALKESKLMLEKELNKTTLTSIKAQMNPHFIFNALNTIQSYVYMNDKKNAGIYISKFSDLTRSILEMSNKETISVYEEITTLELYLSLEKMRFEDSFEYAIQVSDKLEVDKIMLPSMLIQPYVENAVKHGLLHKKSNRELHIYFEQEHQFLKIIIDDNGIGRKQSEALKSANNKGHQSFAMEANKKRLEILLQKHKDITLEIIDKQNEWGDATGTQVVIKLPI